MFADNAGDVVIDNDDFVSMSMPLLGENTDCRRAAADPHAGFASAIDHRRCTSSDGNCGALINAQFDVMAIQQLQKCVAGDAALAFASTGQVPKHRRATAFANRIRRS